jgi:[acyl-carrier-protein] S-malonyltransferase
MGQEVFATSQAARDAFGAASDAVGIDLRSLCFEGDEESLRRTENTQIALYAVSVATAAALREAAPCAPPPVALAGHSVGEYAALAVAGVFSVEDGARLVKKRGDLMARAGNLRPGSMAAVLGMDDAALDEILKGISREGHAVVSANYNSPGQVVISGDAEAVAEACEKLKEAGAKRCLPLNVSGAFHSPLMMDAAAAMAEALKGVRLSLPKIPVVSNVTGQVGDDWALLLEEQLRSPVRWTTCIETMREMGAGLFLECGCGEVLSGLLKRIDSEAKAMPLADPVAIQAAAGVIEGVTA